MQKSFLLLHILILGLISSCSKSDESSTPVPKDIYTAGYELNGTNDVAKYWKNGIANYLSDGTKEAEAQSKVVVGNVVNTFSLTI